MGKRRKLRKLMKRRDLVDMPAVVVCTGKKCASRSESRAVVDAARAHVERNGLTVRVECAGCLHICKDGPIAATYPKIRFKRHVDDKRVRKLVDKVEDRARRK